MKGNRDSLGIKYNLMDCASEKMKVKMKRKTKRDINKFVVLLEIKKKSHRQCATTLHNIQKYHSDDVHKIIHTFRLRRLLFLFYFESDIS